MERMVSLVGCLTILCSPFGSALTNMKQKIGVGEPLVENFLTLPSDEWCEQKLDHFDPMNNATWKQRYGTTSSFFKPGSNGPVFLMIGGEGEISKSWLVTGTWIDYAKKYGALCFQLEHRYYGKSHPKPDLSTKNLKYLSSEQALADSAYFITEMNQKYNLNHTNKWIAFGGSYSGSLAAWLRSKYPHLVHAAVSSSGPLLAKADFYEYYEVVAASLATHSEQCVQSVHNASIKIQQLLKHPDGRKQINKDFKLCDGVNVHNEKDITNLFTSLADTIAGVVQYNKDNPTDKITIDTICDILVNKSIGTPVKRYAALINFMLEEYNLKCFDYKYDKMIKKLRSTDYVTHKAERQWSYQTCTEFGFYQTSEKNSSLFGPTFNLKFFEDFCTDVFGTRFNPEQLNQGIYRTNVMYGGLDIDVTRVVFVQGSIDPWHALGITNSTNPNAPSIFIKGTAHCADMYPDSPHDLPQLKEARHKIFELIGKWLKET